MPTIQIADKPTLDGVASSLGSVASDVTYIKDNLPSGGSMPMDVRDVSYIDYPETNSILIKWLDPLQSVENSNWAGTKLVRKEGSAPASPADGTVVVDNTTRDGYYQSGFIDTYSGDQYVYYRFFPYDTNGNHYTGSLFVVDSNDKYKLCSFANGTSAELGKLILAAKNGKVDLYADAGWRVGDTRKIYFNTYKFSNSSAIIYEQLVDLILVDAGETSETDGLFSSTHTTCDVLCSKTEKNKDGTDRNHPLFTVLASFNSANYEMGWLFTSTGQSRYNQYYPPYLSSVRSNLLYTIGIFEKMKSTMGGLSSVIYETSVPVCYRDSYGTAGSAKINLPCHLPYVENIYSEYSIYSYYANVYNMYSLSELKPLTYYETTANIPTKSMPLFNIVARSARDGFYLTYKNFRAAPSFSSKMDSLMLLFYI